MTVATEVNPFFASLAVLELLVDATRRAPVLVCVDDLHWWDQPSIDALAFVCRRVASERMAVLCSARSGFSPFADAHTVEWMELGGIDEAAAVELLEIRAPHLSLPVRERVLGQARGNPLALLEFAAALESGRPAWTEADDGLPMSTRLERAFVARAEHLDHAARTVLTVAAVDDGDDFDDVLAAAQILHGSPNVPEAVTRATLKQYRHSDAVTDLLEFPDRAHSLTIDHGWRDVADASLTWLRKQGL